MRDWYHYKPANGNRSCEQVFGHSICTVTSGKIQSTPEARRIQEIHQRYSLETGLHSAVPV